MKRTIKRLEALAQGKSGVQINMSRSRIKVSTRYTPLVVGVGKTLPGAVEDCVHWLLDWLKDHPYWAPKLKNVLDALHSVDAVASFQDDHVMTEAEATALQGTRNRPRIPVKPLPEKKRD